MKCNRPLYFVLAECHLMDDNGSDGGECGMTQEERGWSKNICGQTNRILVLAEESGPHVCA